MNAPLLEPAVRKVDYFKNRIRNGHGTLIKDERASGGELREYKTFTCMHCGCVVVMHPKRRRVRGFCAKHNGLVCDDKLCNQECFGIDKCVDLMMANPTANIAWLSRGYNGELLFDRALLDIGKVY